MVLKGGEPRWLSQLSVWLWIRSWPHVSRVAAPHEALRWSAEPALDPLSPSLCPSPSHLRTWEHTRVLCLSQRWALKQVFKSWLIFKKHNKIEANRKTTKEYSNWIIGGAIGSSSYASPHVHAYLIWHTEAFITMDLLIILKYILLWQRKVCVGCQEQGRGVSSMIWIIEESRSITQLPMNY